MRGSGREGGGTGCDRHRSFSDIVDVYFCSPRELVFSPPRPAASAASFAPACDAVTLLFTHVV